MAYARRTSSRRAPARRAPARRGYATKSTGMARRRAPARRRSVGMGRARSSAQTVRVVIEHQAADPMQRPTMLQGSGDVNAPKKAKF